MEAFVVGSVVAIFGLVIAIGAVRTYIALDRWFGKPVEK